MRKHATHVTNLSVPIGHCIATGIVSWITALRRPLERQAIKALF